MQSKKQKRNDDTEHLERYKKMNSVTFAHLQAPQVPFSMGTLLQNDVTHLKTFTFGQFLSYFFAKNISCDNFVDDNESENETDLDNEHKNFDSVHKDILDTKQDASDTKKQDATLWILQVLCENVEIRKKFTTVSDIKTFILQFCAESAFEKNSEMTTEELENMNVFDAESEIVNYFSSMFSHIVSFDDIFSIAFDTKDDNAINDVILVEYHGVAICELPLGSAPFEKIRSIDEYQEFQRHEVLFRSMLADIQLIKTNTADNNGNFAFKEEILPESNEKTTEQTFTSVEHFVTSMIEAEKKKNHCFGLLQVFTNHKQWNARGLIAKSKSHPAFKLALLATNKALLVRVDKYEELLIAKSEKKIKLEKKEHDMKFSLDTILNIVFIVLAIVFIILTLIFLRRKEVVNQTVENNLQNNYDLGDGQVNVDLLVNPFAIMSERRGPVKNMASYTSSESNVFPLSAFVVSNSFQLNNIIRIVSLQILADYLGPGGSRIVSIWNLDTRTLLVQGTVSFRDPIVNGYYVHPLSPNEYVILNASINGVFINYAVCSLIVAFQDRYAQNVPDMPTAQDIRVTGYAANVNSVLELPTVFQPSIDNTVFGAFGFDAEARNLPLFSIDVANGYGTFPPNYINGLTINSLPNAVQMAANGGFALDNTQMFNMVSSSVGVLTIVPTNIGVPGGLDRDNFVPNEWYTVYLINSTAQGLPAAGLLSHNQIDPDLTSNPGLTGYDTARQIGFVRSNDNGDGFLQSTQTGNGQRRQTFYLTPVETFQKVFTVSDMSNKFFYRLTLDYVPPLGTSCVLRIRSANPNSAAVYLNIRNLLTTVVPFMVSIPVGNFTQTLQIAVPSTPLPHAMQIALSLEYTVGDSVSIAIDIVKLCHCKSTSCCFRITNTIIKKTIKVHNAARTTGSRRNEHIKLQHSRIYPEKKRKKKFISNFFFQKKMSKLVMFDLDDTLVGYKKHKMFLPRQTFHCLRNLSLKGFTIVIVTYNPLGEFIASMLGLLKYSQFLVWSSNVFDRSKLIEKVFMKLYGEIQKNVPFFYFDDRDDNITQVSSVFPLCTGVQVKHVVDLHLLIKQTICNY